MEDVKSALASKTVWAGILGLGASIAGIFGYVIAAEDVATLSELLPGIVTAITSVVAIYGRIVATKAIK